MAAAAQWAEDNDTERCLNFEKWFPDPDGDWRAPPQAHWASQTEVWGNYELYDGDMVHGGVAGKRRDARKPDFEARVRGDGIFGDNVWISVANRPKSDLKGSYWCKVVRNSAAYHNMRTEIQQGAAGCKLPANIRAEPRDCVHGC